MLDLPNEKPVSPEAAQLGAALEIAGFKVSWPLGVPYVATPPTLDEKRRLIELSNTLNARVEIGSEGVVFGPPGFA